MGRAVGLVLSLLLLTCVAHALMPPEVYRKAREEAAYHVEVDVTKVDAPRTGPGTCLVEGQVLRLFKNTGDKLAKDEIIGFPVACRRQGDTVPIGGTMWLDTDALEKAEYIEVYLNDSGDGFEPALWNYKLIDKLSDEPQLPVDPR
jgi:hypothetical protein